MELLGVWCQVAGVSLASFAPAFFALKKTDKGKSVPVLEANLYNTHKPSSVGHKSKVCSAALSPRTALFISIVIND